MTKKVKEAESYCDKGKEERKECEFIYQNVRTQRKTN
jgi:hypothetical protein